MSMKKSLAGIIAIGCAAAAQLHAQTVAASAPPPLPHEPASNIMTGIDPDRFIGDASRSITRISRDGIMTRAILTAGDPLQPGAHGTVLRFRKEVVLGTMQPGEATPLSQMAEQQVIYVEAGHGRLDDGARVWDLSPGFVTLIPGNARHRFTVTGDTALKMLMMAEPARQGANAPTAILVRDPAKILYIEQGAHWSNFSKAPFNDVGERFLIVYMGPMSIAGAHAHNAETEEGWVKLTDGPALLQIGSEIRPWRANMGMISPPNGETVHAAINTSNDIQAWFYFATMPPPPPRPAGSPPRPPVDPAILESVQRSTVASRPLRSVAQ